MQPPPSAIAALFEGSHADPFSVLGLHQGPGGGFARAILPGATTAEAFSLAGTALGTLHQIDPRGLFEGAIAAQRQPLRYRCTHDGHEWWITDPYSFGPVLGPTDDFLIGEGTHFRLFDKMGAHVIDHEGVTGVHFAVWAPNARGDRHRPIRACPAVPRSRRWRGAVPKQRQTDRLSAAGPCHQVR